MRYPVEPSRKAGDYIFVVELENLNTVSKTLVNQEIYRNDTEKNQHFIFKQTLKDRFQEKVKTTDIVTDYILLLS